MADSVLLVTIVSGVVWATVVIALFIGMGRLRSGESPALPSVSVLIAARNEEQVIARCLKALAAQDYPPERREIILIDDGSSDRTQAIGESFVDELPNFRVIPADPSRSGVAPKKNALLTGINASTGDIILTTDADCAPPPGWLSGMVKRFTEGVDAVVGYSPVVVRMDSSNSRFPVNNAGKIKAGCLNSLIRFDALVNAVVSAGSIGIGAPVTAVGRNFAYRRSAWEKAGGFGGDAATASGDDDLLLQRIASSGGKVAFATEKATHVPAFGAASLIDWLRMKRRHKSAGKSYPTGMIALSAILYLFNVGIVATAILALTGALDWLWMAAIAAVKWSIDGAALRRGGRLLGERSWGGGWLAAEVISPLAFALLVPAPLFGRVRWKGRKLNASGGDT